MINQKRDTKRPWFESDGLVRKYKELSKLLKLIGEYFYKDHVTVGHYCNHKDYNHGRYALYEVLNSKNKNILDKWICSSRSANYKKVSFPWLLKFLMVAQDLAYFA